MRERINRLARGIVDGGVPGLMIKPERVEGSLGAGQTARGEFLVQSTNDLHIKGLVYSSNKRVKAVNEAFGGLRSHIIYEVDTRYLEDGDEIKGSFFTWSLMVVRGRFLILCVFRRKTEGRN